VSDETHPLDREDETELGPTSPTPASYNRILRFLVIIAVVCGAIACIASAASANAAYMSPTERTGTVVRSVACVVALAACAGMIVIYRLRAFVRARENADRTSFPLSGVLNAAPHTSPVMSPVTGQPLPNPPHQRQLNHLGDPTMADSQAHQPTSNSISDEWDLGIVFVLVVAGLLILLNWGAFFFGRSIGMYGTLISVALLSLQIGLSTMMIVFQTGVCRAFGIGWLTTGLVGQISSFWISSYMYGPQYYRRGSVGDEWLIEFIPPLQTTFGLMLATLCASYVWGLKSYVAWRRHQRLLQAQRIAEATGSPSELHLG